LEWFHDYILLFIFLILILVGGILVQISLSQWIFKEFIENTILELLWTFFPIFILLNIGYFRIILLYNHELESDISLSIKVTGHQWYWSYDFRDFKNLEFDRYIIPLTDLSPGEFRLLEVDNRLIIPQEINSRFIVSRADVLHSWTLPRIGVKVDANPGRLNIIDFSRNFLGLFYGQCREICGANHRFIPICLEVTNLRQFKNWVNFF